MCNPNSTTKTTATTKPVQAAGEGTKGQNGTSTTNSPTTTTTNTTTPRVLLTLDSYAKNEDQPPTSGSIFITGVVILIGLICSEMIFRLFFFLIKDWHSILQEEVNRQILARHIGVDSFALFLLTLMGWQGRSIVKDIFDEWFFGKKGAFATAAYLKRFYTVHPEAVRISMFFMWYQVKNLYDSIVWDDGIEYVGHHIFSIFTAWCAIGPFFCHYYSLFFFGISEVSTCVLCILANFDDKHGVVGLGDAFPLTKVVVGVVFVCFFIICRCIIWPLFSYTFFLDTKLALKELDPRTTLVRQRWLMFLCVSLTALSVLQVAWLGQIFIIAKEEFTKIGLL